MDRASYLASLRGDADLLLTTAAESLERPVPTCPGWSCERLLGHVGRVHRWTAEWVSTGAAHQVEPAPAGDAVVDWCRTGVEVLLAALDAADPEERVDTWAGTQPASFWPRRMAIETALHRFDAQAAAGSTTPIATDLALDGIDEMFTVVLPWRGVGGLGGGAETIHLHATDPDLDASGGEWLVTLGSDALSVDRIHAKGDVAVRGSASDLLLLLWNRVGPDRLGVFGDASLLDRWREAITI